MDEQRVAKQTSEVVRCLFEDVCQPCCIETDSGDSFDPVPIANKLKEISDQLVEDTEFQKALLEFKKAQHEQKAMDAAFSQAVDRVCPPLSAEVTPEMQLIKAAVSLGLYINSQAPKLNREIQRAMNSFLNLRVGQFVAQQGGWDAVEIDHE
ncbi:hypothetical protein NHX12_031048 [Muraenolepis orangiensis]|uniref:Bcl-2-like protein 15 n=1 Tax=Muraenolepis orangiensis TaxID=630683 RepID=A0A9Q0EAR3_9TELE|nr:hypothetical protein NHX12_031048 [Muraenolepis orangiensis]